jgi:hypothetical protein
LKGSCRLVVIRPIAIDVPDRLLSNATAQDCERLFDLIDLLLSTLVFAIVLLCLFCACLSELEIDGCTSLFLSVGKRFEAIGRIYHDILIVWFLASFLFLFYNLDLLIEGSFASI